MHFQVRAVPDRPSGSYLSVPEPDMDGGRMPDLLLCSAVLRIPSDCQKIPGYRFRLLLSVLSILRLCGFHFPAVFQFCFQTAGLRCSCIHQHRLLSFDQCSFLPDLFRSIPDFRILLQQSCGHQLSAVPVLRRYPVQSCFSV